MKDSGKSPLDEATLLKSFDDEELLGKSKNPEVYPLLEIQSGPKQGTWFTIAHQKEITIGRASVNSILLEDSSISRSHAIIHEADGKYFVRDVGSRNGTFVNEKKIQENYEIKQGDIIKVGIYLLKFLVEPSEDFDDGPPLNDSTVLDENIIEEAKKKREAAQPPVPSEKLETQSLDSDRQKQTASSGAALMKSQAPSDPKEATSSSSKKGGKGIKLFLYFFVALILVGGTSYTFYKFYFKGKFPIAKKIPRATLPKTNALPETQPKQTSVETAPALPPAISTTLPMVETAPVLPANAGPAVPVFLDVSAQPLQAKIYFQGKDLGVTPFRVNVSVPVGVPQEIIAIYHFNELNLEFSEKRNFTVSKQDEIITLRYDGTLGSLQIKKLPNNTQAYLEGTFASNQLKSQAVKLDDIIYNHPIYLPFGNYTFELKQMTRLEGAENEVSIVKYHRDFILNKEAPNFEINLTDQDLTYFPAKLTSHPSGADVFVDGKKYGSTSFEGNLPLGKHKLTLKKEGYFDEEQPLDVSMNTPLTLDITLRTSEAGQFINKGKDLIRQEQFQQAVDSLAESLKHNPSVEEIGRVHILLGQSYLKLGNNDVALGYFEKAKTNPHFKSRADLGIAETNFNLGRKETALSRIIDVILNEKDEKMVSDAETLFHKVSPLKSVILVSTEPKGAKVTLNRQEISQPTPVVLSDLSLGSYYLLIEKPGYKPYESRFQMILSTFKPVVVKLEPQL